MDEVKEYNAEFIVKLIRLHFEEQVSIEEISRNYNIPVELITKWKDEFLEGAKIIFSNSIVIDQIKFENRIKSLKASLKQKEKIIVKLEKDNQELKKMLCSIENENSENEF